MTPRVRIAFTCAWTQFVRLFRLAISTNRIGMEPLLLCPEMMVRPGVRVIAHEVASRRARRAFARSAVKHMRGDPLRRSA
jgi:hypothetical protein